MKVIMLSGKSGSGKDAVANVMENKFKELGYRTLIIHFADLVKYYAIQYYKWNGEKDEVGRNLLQAIGTGMMRNYDPDYWAAIVAKFIDAAKNDFDITLIPDWRFINEYENVDDYNREVYTIRVNRYNQDGTSYTNPNMSREQLAHVSETQLDNFAFNYIIENRGGLEDLEASVDLIVNELIKKEQ